MAPARHGGRDLAGAAWRHRHLRDVARHLPVALGNPAALLRRPALRRRVRGSRACARGGGRAPRRAAGREPGRNSCHVRGEPRDGGLRGPGDRPHRLAARARRGAAQRAVAAARPAARPARRRRGDRERRLRRGAWDRARRPDHRRHQGSPQAVHGHRHHAVARVHVRDPARRHFPGPRALRNPVDEPQGARHGARHGRRVQRRQFFPAAGRRCTRRDRRGGRGARPLRRRRRLRARRPVQSPLHHRGAARARDHGDRLPGDLPGRGGLPAQRGDHAPDRPGARTDRDAEGLRLRDLHDCLALPEAGAGNRLDRTRRRNRRGPVVRARDGGRVPELLQLPLPRVVPRAGGVRAGHRRHAGRRTRRHGTRRAAGGHSAPGRRDAPRAATRVPRHHPGTSRTASAPGRALAHDRAPHRAPSAALGPHRARHLRGGRHPDDHQFPARLHWLDDRRAVRAREPRGHDGDVHRPDAAPCALLSRRARRRDPRRGIPRRPGPTRARAPQLSHLGRGNRARRRPAARARHVAAPRADPGRRRDPDGVPRPRDPRRRARADAAYRGAGRPPRGARGSGRGSHPAVPRRQRLPEPRVAQPAAARGAGHLRRAPRSGPGPAGRGLPGTAAHAAGRRHRGAGEFDQPVQRDDGGDHPVLLADHRAPRRLRRLRRGVQLGAHRAVGARSRARLAPGARLHAGRGGLHPARRDRAAHARSHCRSASRSDARSPPTSPPPLPPTCTAFR